MSRAPPGPEPGATWTEETEAAPVDLAGGYEDLGPLASGAMGEVRRVRDVALDRLVARKTIRPELRHRPDLVRRFVEEARITASLQHPGIVAVHSLGRSEDGEWSYTMDEVVGRTFGACAEALHAASGAGEWRPEPGGLSLRALVRAFADVCNAVGFAHSRGVVHRDLKPDNVVVGEFGAVRVLDWGIARRVERSEPDGAAAAVADGAPTPPPGLTRFGAVVGSPGWMAPEQARGELGRVGPPADVHALGAMLEALLTGRTPAGAPARDDLPVPAELLDLARRCRSEDPAARPPDAREVAREVEAWLDQAGRADRAAALVREAERTTAEADAARADAEASLRQASAALAALAPWTPSAEKAPHWDAVDEATRRLADATTAEERARGSISAALALDPTHLDAHRWLAERARRQLAASEERADPVATAGAEARLRRHLDALPATDAGRRSAEAWLRGDGALTLVTDAPATVEVFRYVPQGIRWGLVPVGVAETPLHARPLPHGRYLCVLRAEGRAEVRYPVAIGRQEHWDGVPPGAHAPWPVHLPVEGALEPGEAYVPGGWARIGGDPEATASLPATRVWIDGFAIDAYPCSNDEYGAFLDAVWETDPDAVSDLLPRERAGAEDRAGDAVYTRTPAGWRPGADAEGDVWHPDWPVLLCDFRAAVAWARWRAARTGRPYRVPGELEFEKAARGVDGRPWPWGDRFDPTLAAMREAAARPLPARRSEFPHDTSPYGVRHVAGSVRTWCAEPYTPRGLPVAGQRARPCPVPWPPPLDPRDRRVARGGHWDGSHRVSRCADRDGYEPGSRLSRVGLRCVRAVGPAAPDGGSS